jgi:hypothetical protein
MDAEKHNANDVSLRTYVDVRFEALEKQTSLALAAAEKAVTKAEVANEKRFENVNEFRQSLNDNARLLMPRVEAEKELKVLSDQISNLTGRINSREERGVGMQNGWAYLIAVVAVISSIIGCILALKK